MRRGLLAFVAAVSMAAASMVSAVQAAVVSFGSGANVFQMEFVTIGNPRNLADTNGLPNPAGSVDYTYRIGKFEVSEDMIDKYNADFGTDNFLMITKDTRGANKPATSVSWNEAARFVNWLNISTGNQAAYKFSDGSGVNDNIQLWQAGDAGYDSSNPYRNSLAKYVLPNFNEWYKAAYYSPSRTYFAFPNGSNTEPAAVASGSDANTAVFSTVDNDGNLTFAPSGPANVDEAGGLSPYGVMGLGGNVFEWEESSFDLLNSSESSHRAVRGGAWGSLSGILLSSDRNVGVSPGLEDNGFGFRVVRLSSSAGGAVPEPSMMVIGTLFGLGGLVAKRRMKK